MDQEGDVRLAQGVGDSGVDVDDGVGHGELEDEAQDTTDTGGEDNGSRGGDLCVRALLGQVEGGVEPGHGPNDGHEGHEDADSVGPVGQVVKPPCDLVGVELW